MSIGEKTWATEFMGSAARSTHANGTSRVSWAQSSFWARPGRRRGTFASPLPIHISSLGNSFTRMARRQLRRRLEHLQVLAHCYHQGTDFRHSQSDKYGQRHKNKRAIHRSQSDAQGGGQGSALPCSLPTRELFSTIPRPNARHNAGLRSCVRFRCYGRPEARIISDDGRGFDPQYFRPIVSSRD